MRRFWRNQRLLLKLITIVLVSILTTLITLFILLSYRMSMTTQNNEEENLLNLARQIASEEIVISATETKQTNQRLINYAQSFTENFGLDYTVIMTPDSIRLTHPNTELIHQIFQGNDQYKAFAGLEYTSLGEGTLGKSLRSFVPIVNSNEEIIGAVSLGLTIENLEQIIERNMQPFTLVFILSIVLGISLATVVAYSLKKQMLDMEPDEIARVLEERNAMIEYASDAIFVTDSDNKMILVNKESKIHFNVNKNNSQYIYDVLPFLIENQPFQDKAKRGDMIYTYNNKEYVLSHAPIIVKENLVGHLYTLRDATELYSLTSQLYSTSEYALTLEAQQHDFLNKLHVIYGLTDLEEYEELKKYLMDLIEPEQEFSKRVAYLIHNPAISGFLIGERRFFSENQLPFTIEIYPDIPSTENYKFVQVWIDQVKFIDKLLFESPHLTEIHLKLAYFDDKIITTYQIRGDVEDLIHQIIKFEHHSSILDKGKKWLTLHFELPYEQSE